MVKLKNYKNTKSNIFITAIKERLEVKFLYNLRTILIHPYYISKDKYGQKVVYGKLSDSYVIDKFEFKYMANIKILDDKKFSPIIPIISMVS